MQYSYQSVMGNIFIEKYICIIFTEKVLFTTYPRDLEGENLRFTVSESFVSQNLCDNETIVIDFKLNINFKSKKCEQVTHKK